MFILHNKRFDMTSWFGFPEYIFCSERDIHLFIFFTYLVRRILNIYCKYYVIDMSYFLLLFIHLDYL